MDSLGDIDFTDLIPLIVAVIEGSKIEKLPRNTGQPGGNTLKKFSTATPGVSTMYCG
jgi:hypothetical protein